MSATAKGLFTAEGAPVAAPLLVGAIVLAGVGAWAATRLASCAGVRVFRA